MANGRTKMRVDPGAFVLPMHLLSQQLQGRTQDQERAKAGPRKSNVEEMKTTPDTEQTHTENSINVKRGRGRQD